jgi:[acyl-carrier-protein] S-malonyltransferase
MTTGMEEAAMDPAAFVFPGQGSQLPGMGSDLAQHDGRYRRLMAEASRLSGVDLTRSLRAVPEDGAPLSTVATQLSVFALSVSLGRTLLEGGLCPGVVAGHSLGELSALVVGGWLDVDAGLELVAARARAMDLCCIATDGAMIAVAGLDETRLREAVDGTGAGIANVNSPRQIVLSGRTGAVAAAARRALAAGATMAVDLPVAGAFHSPLMAAAELELVEHIERLPLRRGGIPLISSVTGRYVEDLGAYRRSLAGQITAPVRWVDVMRLIAAEPGDVVEVGPGAVLRGLFRQLDRRRTVVTCGDLQDCASLLAAHPVPARPRIG